MIRNLLFRIEKYYEAHGLIETAKKSLTTIRRKLFENKYNIYYADLNALSDEEIEMPEGFKIQHISAREMINEEDWARLSMREKEKEYKKKNAGRLDKGASAWFLRDQNGIVGFVWEIRKKPLRAFYFPLGEKDIFLFDNEIFSEYRGRGLNNIFINYVLYQLKKNGNNRAYIDTAIWNKEEIRSLEKTYFQLLATGKKYIILGKKITIWDDLKRKK